MKRSNKLRPCDCKDMSDAEKLVESGMYINMIGINVEPNIVIIENDTTRLKIPMSIFKKLAKWYLEPQDISPYTVEVPNELSTTSRTSMII